MPIYNPTSAGSSRETLISTVTVSTAVANVTFTAIAATYQDLRVRFSAKGDDAATQYVRLQMNGDTTARYGSQEVSFGAVNVGGHYNGLTYIICGRHNTSATTWARNSGEITIYDYTSTTFDKIVQGDSFTQTDATRVNDGDHWYVAGKWGPTTAAAVTQLVFTSSVGNFVAGTVFSLYGVSV
jgi:hypothetical protein